MCWCKGEAKRFTMTIRMNGDVLVALYVRGITNMRQKAKFSCKHHCGNRLNRIVSEVALALLAGLWFWPGVVTCTTVSPLASISCPVAFTARQHGLLAIPAKIPYLIVDRSAGDVKAYIIAGGLLLLATGMVVLKRRNKK